jgi:hypothetical protein
MMVFNDIALANHSMAEYRKELPRLRQHVRFGALQYLIRIQCGHLVEALGIIQTIQENDRLMNMLQRCSSEVQDAFATLTACLVEPGRREFGKLVRAVRDKVAFHYDLDMVKAALEDRAGRPESARSRIYRSDDLAFWRFEVADHVLDSIVCRQVWKIPRNADLRQEADRILDYAANLCLTFLTFAGEFAPLYVHEHAQI